MKSIHVFLVCALVLVTAACNKSGETEDYKRIVFNSDGLRVVSSSVNKKLETMSLLYANDKAYQSGEGLGNTRTDGEAFKFVTWQYHENPFFYGSKINGELLSVESIHIHQDGMIDYAIDEGLPMPVNGNLLDKEERINYILGHKPSILP